MSFRFHVLKTFLHPRSHLRSPHTVPIPYPWLVVGEYTATSSYCFLLLPFAPSVFCSWLDALNTPSSKLPLSPAVSHCLPLSATRLSLLLNPHPVPACFGMIPFYATWKATSRARGCTWREIMTELKPFTNTPGNPYFGGLDQVSMFYPPLILSTVLVVMSAALYCNQRHQRCERRLRLSGLEYASSVEQGKSRAGAGAVAGRPGQPKREGDVREDVSQHSSFSDTGTDDFHSAMEPARTGTAESDAYTGTTSQALPLCSSSAFEMVASTPRSEVIRCVRWLVG
jgi:hypothetical protein